MVRYEGEVESIVSEESVELFCLIGRPLPRGGFMGVKHAVWVFLLCVCEFGELLDDGAKGLWKLDILLIGDAVAGR